MLTDTDPAAVLIDEGDNAAQVLLDAANILGADAPRTIESRCVDPKWSLAALGERQLFRRYRGHSRHPRAEARPGNYDGVDAPPTASMCQSGSVEHHLTSAKRLRWRSCSIKQLKPDDD